NARISDEEFKEKKRKYYESDGVNIRSKEQLFYYEIYRAVIGVPRPKSKKGKICPQCHSNIPKKATYCRVCGAYPV
ncbi:MAG: asparagine synthase, partial [Candidatus Methanomethylicota archaeon]